MNAVMINPYNAIVPGVEEFESGYIETADGKKIAFEQVFHQFMQLMPSTTGCGSYAPLRMNQIKLKEPVPGMSDLSINTAKDETNKLVAVGSFGPNGFARGYNTVDARQPGNNGSATVLKISQGDPNGRLAKLGLKEAVPQSDSMGGPMYIFNGDENSAADLKDPSKWTLGGVLVSSFDQGGTKSFGYSPTSEIFY